MKKSILEIHKRLYRSNLFPEKLCAINLLAIGSCSNESIRQRGSCQLSNAGADAKCLYPVCPEELISEERFDNGGYAS